METQAGDRSARNGRTAALLGGVMAFLVALTIAGVILLN
jgi:hypothetical protein